MEFQPEKEAWSSYAERLDHFFRATKITDDEKKVFTLIHQNGPSLFTLLKDLCFPTNPTLMSYDDIMNTLNSHYVGEKSVFYERKVFYKAQMSPYESASDWHRRLKGLSMNCKFGDSIEGILVDKFVTGFQGKVLQRLFEKDENLTLQQALEIAQRYEYDLPSGKDYKQNEKSECQQQLAKQSKRQQAQSTQHYQDDEQRHETQTRQQLNRRPQQGHCPKNNEQQPQQETARKIITCYKCGKKGHYANVCRSTVAKTPDHRKEQGSECCIS